MNTLDTKTVLLRIGELGTKVDGLVSSVTQHGSKLDDIGHKVSFVKGALWVLGGVVAVLTIGVIWYFSGKLSITLLPNP